MIYLIDTNLLVLLVVGMTDPRYIEKHKRVRGVYDVKKFNRLAEIVQQAQALVCTPNILTETSNLLRQIHDPIRTELMAQLAAFIEVSEERYVESKAAAAVPSFLRLGLTDASVFAMPSDDLTVLTDDAEFADQCARAKVKVENLTSYLQE